MQQQTVGTKGRRKRSSGTRLAARRRCVRKGSAADTAQVRCRARWALLLALAAMLPVGDALAAPNCPAETPCSPDDSCGHQLVKVCARGPNQGRQCATDADCSGSVCRPAWREYYIDAGQDISGCAPERFGGKGSDGVFLGDPDDDGDMDVVTGWEESGNTYVYTNPCNPPDPNNPTSCGNPGGVLQEWASPYAPNPADVTDGNVSTSDIEDAAFYDYDSDGTPDAVITATEGYNKHVTLHARAHNGKWLGKKLPGDEQMWMQVRAADINGDDCADIVAGTKFARPGCIDGLLENPCSVCDDFNVKCGPYGGVWWWECPKIDGACQPFGPKFSDSDPEMDLSRWNKRKIKRDLTWIMGLELTDMDGDGDTDVFVSDRLMIGWFENTINVDGNQDGWGDPHVIDHMDAVIARGDGTRFSSGEPFRFHAYGDVDGDDLEDLVVAAGFSKGSCSGDPCTYCSTNSDCPPGQTCENSGSPNAGRMAGYYYRRIGGTGRLWSRHQIFVEGGLPYGIDVEGDAVSKAVAIGDVTGDGHNDLVFSVRGAGHALYSLSFDPDAGFVCAPCETAEWKARAIAPCRTGSKYDNVQLADLDADGRLDVVTSEENFQADRGNAGHSSGLGVVWYRNLGFCGNGILDVDEECDNGEANGDDDQCCSQDCTFRTGHVCRPTTGPCDKGEVCQSGSAVCPADTVKPKGLVCTLGFDCDFQPHECDGLGSCVPNDPTSCTDNSQCDSGLCLPVSNICANACDRDFNLDGTPNECTHDVCGSNGFCTHPPKAPATPCDDDGNDCTIHQCDGSGTCQTVFLGTNTNCGTLPMVQCDDLNFCDGAGNCIENIKPAGTICRASRGPCDSAESCNGENIGCPPDLFIPQGMPCAHASPNQSCSEDERICFGYCSEYQCDNFFRCVEVGIDEGKLCYDDGNECSEHRCAATWCIRESVGPSAPCTDDGITCTQDFCRGIECIHPPVVEPIPCEDDGNPCTDDVCDIFTGECAHVPVPGRPCEDDGDECTEDVCGDDGNCYPPTPDKTPCADDGTVCTNDHCIAGICQHPADPKQTACESDDNECTDDVCNAGDCTPVALTGQTCADDENECTTDVCDELGACTHPPVQDLLACTDDGNECTMDRCISGTCGHPPRSVGIPCGDSTTTECDLADACDGAGNCAPNVVEDATPCTPDQLACTVDECRSGVCVHAAELPLPPFNKEDPAYPLCGGHALLPVGNPPNDVIRAFAVFDDGNGEAIYAGGSMLHKWDGAVWTQIGVPGGIADTIRSLEVASDLPFGGGPVLYLGGSLVAPLDGPQPLLRWDGATWMIVGSFNGPVHALEAVGGTLYTGGAFTSVDYLDFGGPISGLVVNHVARLTQMDLEFDPPNVVTTWEALGAGTDGVVHALAWGLYSCSPHDRMGVGGAFTTAGGLPATGFAYLDLSGAGWGTPDPLLPPDGGTIPVVYTVAAIKPPFDYFRPLHIGGLFRVPQTNSPTGFSNNAARLLDCGGNWWGLEGGGATSDGLHAVRSIAPAVDASGQATFIGGDFETFNDVVAPQIARVENWTHSLGSCLNGSVVAMMAFDDGTGEALYVGGQFTNGSDEHFVARWRSLPGDLDGDGIVTAADFTFSNDWSNGMLWCLAGPTRYREGCCDLNKDNRVDMRDVGELVNLMGTTE